MKLFSRIALICNVSFIIFIFLGYIELNHKRNKVDDNIMPLPFVTGTVVVLGQLAIFINIIFCLLALVLLARKRKQVPQWLMILNFLFLLLQVYYFFI